MRHRNPVDDKDLGRYFLFGSRFRCYEYHELPALVHIAHGLVDEDAAELMCQSRIVINLHNLPYLNFETRVIHGLLCNRFMLTEKLTLPIVKDSNLMYFQNKWELYELCQKLISEDQKPFQNDRTHLRDFHINHFFELMCIQNPLNKCKL